jgi:hypothetical protein
VTGKEIRREKNGKELYVTRSEFSGGRQVKEECPILAPRSTDRQTYDTVQMDLGCEGKERVKLAQVAALWRTVECRNIT